MKSFTIAALFTIVIVIEFNNSVSLSMGLVLRLRCAELPDLRSLKRN